MYVQSKSFTWIWNYIEINVDQVTNKIGKRNNNPPFSQSTHLKNLKDFREKSSSQLSDGSGDCEEGVVTKRRVKMEILLAVSYEFIEFLITFRMTRENNVSGNTFEFKYHSKRPLGKSHCLLC